MPIPTFQSRGDLLSTDEQRQLLSTRLRLARTQLKLTQGQFAAECGISIATYKRFELGTCDSLKVLLKIVGVFNRTTALDLLFPAEPTVPPQPRNLLAVLDQLNEKRRAKP
jgi:transcriptional regulator with XRE-family HTH domain